MICRPSTLPSIPRNRLGRCLRPAQPSRGKGPAILPANPGRCRTALGTCAVLHKGRLRCFRSKSNSWLPNQKSQQATPKGNGKVLLSPGYRSRSPKSNPSVPQQAVLKLERPGIGRACLICRSERRILVSSLLFQLRCRFTVYFLSFLQTQSSPPIQICSSTLPLREMLDETRQDETTRPRPEQQ